MKNITSILKQLGHTMKNANKLFVFILMLLAGNNLKAANYYWVGGTGNWSDFANHWATTSGGSAFHTAPPDSTDDVYFDSNSFSSPFQTVAIDFDVCHNFDCSGTNTPFTLVPLSLPWLTICGSFNVNNNFHTLQVTLDFVSYSLGNTIQTGGNNNLQTFSFSGTGEWSFLDSFEAFDLSCIGFGTLKFNGNNITVPNFQSNNMTLNTGPSTITTQNIYTYASVINGTGSRLIIQNGGGGQVSSPGFDEVFATNSTIASGGGLQFACNKLILDSSYFSVGYLPSFVSNLECNGCELYTYFDGSMNINHGIINGNASLGSITFDTLYLNNPGDSVVIYSNDTVTINNLLVANTVAGSNTKFVSDSATYTSYLQKLSGQVCLQNFSLQNIHAIGGAQFFAGTGCVDNGNNAGWQFAPCSIVSDVWPGDANYDLTVNNNDVLNIGLAYSETGPVRAGATINYVAQPATDWNGYFQTAVNKKHADTNGDGVVDDNDTLAIVLNYGQNHPARYAQGANQNATGAPLYLVASPDSAALSDTVYVEAWLGTSQFPVDSIYGIAFSISYDTALVDTNWFSFDFPPSWFGTPGVDELAFVKNIPLEGRMDFALTRTDHNNASGFGGPLTRTGIVIVDNVAGRMPLPFTISNAYALTASEFEILISTLGDTVSVDTTALTGINNLQQTTVHAYPNPFGNFLLPQKVNEQSNLQLINEMGQIVLSQTLYPNEKKIIDTRNLKKGIYVLNVSNSKINSRVKMVKL